MKQRFSSMGEVLTYLKKSNINNVDERADYIQDFIDSANQDIGYEYDRYIEFGASNFANVVTEHSGGKKECILWCVNHYLSLNRNAKVIEKAVQTLRQYGTGCGTSAASCGMSSLHKKIEKKVAHIIGKEKALLFPTGFTANTAAISYLTGKNDLIIFDRECHSSIINGLKLSEAKWISFKHNNVKDLTSKLHKYHNSFQNVFVIVESAYSMSGDLAPLREIVALKDILNFYLYVDEAHTFGIYGNKGQGYCYDQGVTDEVDFIMATLSKATASIGGFVAAKEKYCSLLKWSDPYVFQACIPPADASVILTCLEEIEQNPAIICDLHDKNRYMRDLLTAKGFNLGASQSPIIPIFIKDHKKLQMVVRELYQEGIYSTPICFPAVKVDEGRIRMILNAAHTIEHIETTVNALERICKRYHVIGDNEDPLASVCIREVLEEMIESAFVRAVRSNKPIVLSMVAVDHFAEINEKFSRKTGDRVIMEISSFIKSSIRGTDIVCRSGSDEFALLLMNTASSDTEILCDRIAQKVRDHNWPEIAEGLNVTISIGLTDLGNNNTAIDLLEKALANLSQAKQSGGNQVIAD